MIRSGFIFGLVLTLFLAASCAKPMTDEDALKAIVEEVAGAARNKDVKGVMKYISKNYADDKGNDYNAVKGIVLYEFIKSEKISVFIRGVKAEVKEGRALVDTRVILVRGKEIKKLSDIVPQDAQGFRFNIIFGKEDGQWKVINASWEEAGVAGLL